MKRILTSSGFTLVETFVAIVVLLLAIVGPLTIAQRGLQATLYTRDQLTATYLAQEALELVRFARDSNVLKGSLDGMMPYSGGVAQSGWVTDLTPCRDASGCRVNVWAPGISASPATLFAACTGGNCPFTRCSASTGCDIFYYNSNGRYLYNQSQPNVPTPFTRRLWIENTADPNENIVRVLVEWNSQGQNRSVEIKQRLFNWAGGKVAPQ